jgi:hypothetical protein
MITIAGCVPESETMRGRAGLVVVHGDGSVQTACVEFEGEEADGWEVLQSSGLAPSVDAANAMGVLVCSIDGEGCAFPAEDCLCECRGVGSCTYWAYFTRSPGEGWVYSPLGASAREVRSGDVEAWVWLSGTSRAAPETPPVPDLTFEQVCPAEAARASRPR